MNICRYGAWRIMENLSNCEEKIMIIIWKKKRAITTKEILAGIEEKFGDKWEAETICSFMIRLRKKGYLSADKRGRCYYYNAEVTFAEYKEKKVDELVQRLYEGDKARLLQEISQ